MIVQVVSQRFACHCGCTVEYETSLYVDKVCVTTQGQDRARLVQALLEHLKIDATVCSVIVAAENEEE